MIGISINYSVYLYVLSLTDEIQRFQGNQENIMYFRAEAYLQANFNNPTIFIDTDMLVIKKITEDGYLAQINIFFVKDILIT